MKRIFYILLLLGLFIYSCGPVKTITSNDNTITSMKLLLDTTYNKTQFDSLCIVDSIDPNYRNWLKMSFIDYETNKTINEYTYIKTLNEDEIMYRLIIDETEYNIIKRLTDN